MKIISMKAALESEGKWESTRGGSFWDSEQVLKRLSWEMVKVALRTPMGNKTHGARALVKNNSLVLTGGIYCGSQRHFHAPHFIGVGVPITCEKCIQRGY